MMCEKEAVSVRRIICFLLFVALVLSLTACGDTNIETQGKSSFDTETMAPDSAESEDEALSDEEAISENSDGQKILVAYFSWADNTEQDDIDAVTSASVTVPGNVAQLASYIAEETGGELFSIQVVEPYPADWDECLSRANQEKADDVRPELVKNVEDMEEYDVVFLGYPNWWYSCPMALFSFIESNDFSGKQIYLFCSHGTGGLARSVQDITAVLPDGNISEDVFDAYEEESADSREAVREWLKEIGH